MLTARVFKIFREDWDPCVGESTPTPGLWSVMKSFKAKITIIEAASQGSKRFL
jgi:hypothetical protein